MTYIDKENDVTTAKCSKCGGDLEVAWGIVRCVKCKQPVGEMQQFGRESKGYK